MIEINLLPEELKSKIKAKSPGESIVKSGALFTQDQLFIYVVMALFMVFACVHLYFTVLSISKKSELASLDGQWLKLQPQKKALDEFNQGYQAASQDSGFIRSLTLKKVFWAQKLNKLSLYLPAGLWFNDISFNGKSMVIQGSVISLLKEEINLVNKLLDNLKADQEFFKDFSGFELSSVQKSNIGGYDTADFVLEGALKSK